MNITKKMEAFKAGWVVLASMSMATSVMAGQATELSDPPVPIFADEQPLEGRDQMALAQSSQYLSADNYPSQQGDKTVYLYQGGKPTLICAPLKLCLLELQDGEKVQPNGIHLGDSARWQVSPSVGDGQKTFLVIKPVQVGLDTDLAIVTDKHSYSVRLVSRLTDRMTKIAWAYPDEERAAWAAYYAAQKEQAEQERALQVEQQQAQQQAEKKVRVIPETGEDISQLDFAYSLTGCEKCDWRPLRVYNNGVQTVIQMPNLQGKEAPALLVTNQQGEALVNYRVQGSRYIVDQVFAEAVLVVGVGEQQSRVTITRVGGE